MKNQVIEVLNKEHGKKVLEYWKRSGFDTWGYNGSCTRKNDDCQRYYGVVNEQFNNYSLTDALDTDTEIITLPNEHPERGEKGLVWDECGGIKHGKTEAIFLAYIPGSVYPVVAVNKEHFKDGSFNPDAWTNYERIPKKEEIELTLKVNGKEVSPFTLSKKSWNNLRKNK